MAITKRNRKSGQVDFKYAAATVAVDDRLDCQGVCKDCGNGTLNNETNPAFEYDYSGNPFSDEEDVLVCIACGSSHVDVL